MTEMLNRPNEAPGAAGGEGATREAWLHRAVEAFRPRFAEVGLPLPEKVHVSVGFSYGAKAESRNVLGECWARRASSDGVNHIFISPMASDPAAMLATLLHELIHAADDVAHGHKGPFAEAAVRLGLEGKMTATRAGLGLAAELIVLAGELGEFPHAALNPVSAPVPVPPGSPAPAPEPPIKAGPGKQGTRMIKVTAGDCCGYTARTTRKWLDEGNPRCPHGAEMTPDE